MSVAVTVFTIKIKSAITEFVWYHDKIGQIFRGIKHHTDSLFWFPGDVFLTPRGYIHAQDAEIISEQKNVDPLQNN